MEPIVMLFVVLALVAGFVSWTLRRRTRHNDEPAGADKASLVAKRQGGQALIPPTPPGSGTL